MSHSANLLPTRPFLLATLAAMALAGGGMLVGLAARKGVERLERPAPVATPSKRPDAEAPAQGRPDAYPMPGPGNSGEASLQPIEPAAGDNTPGGGGNGDDRGPSAEDAGDASGSSDNRPSVGGSSAAGRGAGEANRRLASAIQSGGAETADSAPAQEDAGGSGGRRSTSKPGARGAGAAAVAASGGGAPDKAIGRPSTATTIALANAGTTLASRLATLSLPPSARGEIGGPARGAIEGPARGAIGGPAGGDAGKTFGGDGGGATVGAGGEPGGGRGLAPSASSSGSMLLGDMPPAMADENAVGNPPAANDALSGGGAAGTGTDPQLGMGGGARGGASVSVGAGPGASGGGGLDGGGLGGAASGGIGSGLGIGGVGKTTMGVAAGMAPPGAAAAPAGSMTLAPPEIPANMPSSAHIMEMARAMAMALGYDGRIPDLSSVDQPVRPLEPMASPTALEPTPLGGASTPARVEPPKPGNGPDRQASTARPQEAGPPRPAKQPAPRQMSPGQQAQRTATPAATRDARAMAAKPSAATREPARAADFNDRLLRTDIGQASLDYRALLERKIAFNQLPLSRQENLREVIALAKEADRQGKAFDSKTEEEQRIADNFFRQREQLQDVMDSARFQGAGGYLVLAGDQASLIAANWLIKYGGFKSIEAAAATYVAARELTPLAIEAAVASYEKLPELMRRFREETKPGSEVEKSAGGKLEPRKWLDLSAETVHAAHAVHTADEKIREALVEGAHAAYLPPPAEGARAVTETASKAVKGSEATPIPAAQSAIGERLKFADALLTAAQAGAQTRDLYRAYRGGDNKGAWEAGKKLAVSVTKLATPERPFAATLKHGMKTYDYLGGARRVQEETVLPFSPQLASRVRDTPVVRRQLRHFSGIFQQSGEMPPWTTGLAPP